MHLRFLYRCDKGYAYPTSIQSSLGILNLGHTDVSLTKQRVRPED